MSDEAQSLDDSLTYRIFQFVIWLLLFVLIIFRVLTYKIVSNSWIWIINYIGMGVALINLLISKCFKLRSCHHKKFKPFLGFTLFIVAIVCILSIFVYRLQSREYSQSINDIITLLALFFSFSGDIWNGILNIFISYLK